MPIFEGYGRPIKPPFSDYAEIKADRDRLAAEVSEANACIGTVRELIGCQVKNVKDISYEQHSKDIVGRFESLNAEVEQMQTWLNDLQSGMYINCVYCGHQYGPKKSTPISMADVLKQHIEKCPKHPMSALKEQLTQAQAEVERLRDALEDIASGELGINVSIKRARKALGGGE